ncbi:DUF3572 domain-containing protein [Xinfangfangia sp. CPCC 101601]|uniref:DUF3572 domain-containing protein n=1 Tax=Pseudogemmobacter lacusdianii TaxID=3069608 RepID=A0ABU0VVA5_9RHOB|nr:DUF3572 domain-containing protein [Xinfangfangia sp. CPCC 101601]MDQ2065671.1 DUF3572 domain-containing protein [Xinfangfangia sp. CPCC 101601]
MNFTASTAESLALQALGWLAAQDEAFGAFLAYSGTDAGEVRARAAEPELLGSVLDFLLSDEQQLLRFCAETGHAPEAPMRARQHLPGGDVPNWT